MPSGILRLYINVGKIYIIINFFYRSWAEVLPDFEFLICIDPKKGGLNNVEIYLSYY